MSVINKHVLYHRDTEKYYSKVVFFFSFLSETLVRHWVPYMFVFELHKL